MKILKMSVWIVLLWIFQAVFSRFIRVDGIAPELLFVFMLCVAYFETKPSAYITVGSVCGLLAGVLYGTDASFYLIAYVASVLAVSMFAEIIYNKIFLLILPAVFIMTFLVNSGLFVINNVQLDDITYKTAFLSVILPVMIYNTIVAAIIGFFVKKTIYSE